MAFLSLAKNMNRIISMNRAIVYSKALWRANISTSSIVQRKFNFPLTPDEMPRSGGIATMMRLPYEKSAQGLDACFVGIPFDGGASNKVGTRLGPRQIRSESSMLRPYNPTTGSGPFESLMVADIGDISINTFNIKATVKLIRDKITEILSCGCTPLVLGGDHTVSYPILQAMKSLDLVLVCNHSTIYRKWTIGQRGCIIRKRDAGNRVI